MGEKKRIKIVNSEKFLRDPVSFGSLMEFQYGFGREQEEAGDTLFSESDGILLDSLNELGIVVPEIDFWLQMAEKWNKEEDIVRRLYVNNGLESRLGAKYLKQAECIFELIPTSRKTVCIGEEKVVLPVLVNLDKGITYRSLMGVKKYARAQILKDLGVKLQRGHTQKIRTFYGSKDKNVTCFSKAGERIYEGPIEKAPHSIKEAISGYWHEVASWEIGNWQKLLESRDKNGNIICTETKAVLFPDDTKNINEKNETMIEHSSCFMQSIQEKYILKKDTLYRLYLHWLD